ncbi:major facilitator superfamily domain-containing protein [Dipodascopsis tothii]|uniref:major facilitator superfamily domain-containing protein n=1 Tax=Dipodascopsis tothii TaxID=44089 RepID=UPI0034CE1F98
MKADLKLFGQERNLFNTLFNMGYLSGSIPNQFVINRIRPSYWIPLCELIWGVLTMVIASAKNARMIYGIRFLTGFFESSAFPSFQVLLGSWYCPEELAKRVALFEMSSSMASMFSSYLMAGLYATMNGTGGLAAWRWMFIFDGVITLPIAVLGFFCIPDFPTTTRALWLKPWEREYGIRRMAAIGRAPQQRLTLDRVRAIFLRPTIYLSAIPYTGNYFASYTGYFNLWLSSLPNLSVEQVNLIPTAGNGLAVIAAYVWPAISDRTGSRWPFAIVGSVFGIIGGILLSIWHLPFGVLLFANLIPSAGASQPLIITWITESFQDNTELRSMIIAFGNVISYTMSAWLPLLLYPTQDAPHYKYGYQFSILFYGLHIIAVLLFRYHIRWYHRKNNLVLNELGLPVVLAAADVESLDEETEKKEKVSAHVHEV